MIESLRVLKACRKTAFAARRIALQMIHKTIVCAPDELRETLRQITRMQLVKTLGSEKPEAYMAMPGVPLSECLRAEVFCSGCPAYPR